MNGSERSSLLRAAAAIAVVGLLAAAMVAGPAGAKKKKAKGITQAAADARYVNIDEKAATAANADHAATATSATSATNAEQAANATNSSNLECSGCVSSSDLAAPEPWHEVGTLGEPPFPDFGTCGGVCWKNFGGGFNTVAFFKDASGIVHLRGLALCETTNDFDCDADNPIFGLPPGYRPPGLMAVPIQRSEVAARLNIYADGVISIPTVSPDGSYVSLENISFRAA